MFENVSTLKMFPPPTPMVTHLNKQLNLGILLDLPPKNPPTEYLPISKVSPQCMEGNTLCITNSCANPYEQNKYIFGVKIMNMYYLHLKQSP